MSIDTENTRKGLEQANALRDAAGDKYRSDGSGACPECGAWRPSDTHRERWDHEDDCPWVARNANKALLAQCAPDLLTLATAIAAERDTAEAEVTALRTRLSEVEAERDRYKAAAEERESDMHLRIRQGYDKTVADAWRAKVAQVEAERDRLRQARDAARAELDDFMRGVERAHEARAESLAYSAERLATMNEDGLRALVLDTARALDDTFAAFDRMASSSIRADLACASMRAERDTLRAILANPELLHRLAEYRTARADLDAEESPDAATEHESAAMDLAATLADLMAGEVSDAG